MKIRLSVLVPMVHLDHEGKPYEPKPEDFHPNLEHDARQASRGFPVTAIVEKAEYVPDVEDTKAIFKDFLRFKLEGAPPRGFKSSGGYEKGDEDAPFYSEAYLYNLLGKDDARTVLAYLNNLMRISGLDPLQVHREVSAEIAAEEQAEKDRLERVRIRKEFKAKFIKEKGWKKNAGTFSGYTPEQDAEIRKACQDARV